MTKRRKLNPVPDLRSAYTTLDPRAELMTKVPLEQVKSFEEFLDNFDHLEVSQKVFVTTRPKTHIIKMFESLDFSFPYLIMLFILCNGHV